LEHAGHCFIKLFLLWLCKRGADKKFARNTSSSTDSVNGIAAVVVGDEKAAVQLADPTLEAFSQNRWKDAFSNGAASAALLFACREPSLWL
jgi:hypothetical protein